MLAFDPHTATETQTARMVAREMKTRFVSMGKNFAVVGAMFATTDCIVESVSFSLKLKSNKKQVY